MATISYIKEQRNYKIELSFLKRLNKQNELFNKNICYVSLYFIN